MGQSKELIRLDKAVSAQTEHSRREVHRLASAGKITVNGQPVRSCDTRIDLAADLVEIDGRVLPLTRYSYLMLNKPRGVVCATSDAALPTVLDLVPPELMRTGLFPAGRLDKDTEGFVLITNDGDLAHKILAPKSHLPKIYLAVLDKPFSDEVAAAFAEGVSLRPESTREQRAQGTQAARHDEPATGTQNARRGEPSIAQQKSGKKPSHAAQKPAGDETKTASIACMPALLTAEDGDRTHARVILRQGMYHQIKRMFAAFDLTVVTLHRERIGGLALDPALPSGGCRALTAEELALLTTEETR